MRDFVGRHELLLYLGLTIAACWACLGILDPYWAPMLAAFAPAAIALGLTGLSEGESGIRRLLNRFRIWRVRPAWYLVAIGLPIIEASLAIGVAALVDALTAGPVLSPRTAALLRFAWVVFLLAAAEELGWRGYALPRLLAHWPAIVAGLVVGAGHAAVHWPLILLPGRPLSAVPLFAHSSFVVAESILFTWIFVNTSGSLLMATLFHGMSNLALVLNGVIEPEWLPWLRPSVSALIVLLVLVTAGWSLRRREPSTE